MAKSSGAGGSSQEGDPRAAPGQQAAADGASPDAGSQGTAADGSVPAGDTVPAAPAEADGGGPGAAGGSQPPVPDTVPAAAPLTPPAKRDRKPRDPAPPLTEPNAAVRTAPGDHVAFVDHLGAEIRHDEMFTDPGPQFTFMFAAKRVLQRFRYPGQHKESARHSSQLVYPEGARVPRHEAHALMQTVREAAEGKPAGDGTQGS